MSNFNTWMVKPANALSLLVAFSLPFPIRLNSILIVIAFCFFLFLVIGKGTDKNLLRSPVTVLITLLFLVTLIGMLYTADKKSGWGDLERSAFLVSFIVIFQGVRNLRITTFQFLVAFSVGCLIVVLYGLIYATFALTVDQRDQVFTSGHAFFADIIQVHPTYLSVYFIFIFFFLAEIFRTNWRGLSKSTRIGIGSALLFIIAILFFLRSQMSLVVFAMSLLMYAVIVLKRRAWSVTFVLFTITLLVFLLDSSRVSIFFDTYGKNVSSALDQRFSVWRGVMEGIKTAPFLGAGTGGAQELIDKGYAITGFQEGIDNSYNAHNQYLQFLARNGILELVCFLVLLFYSFRQSLKMENYTFLMFNMIVTLIMFTESFLDVQRGIVFFYFFLCAFIYLPYESVTQPNKEGV